MTFHLADNRPAPPHASSRRGPIRIGGHRVAGMPGGARGRAAPRLLADSGEFKLEVTRRSCHVSTCAWDGLRTIIRQMFFVASLHHRC